MKKFLLISFLSVFMLHFSVTAQNVIPNPGFENWESNSNATDWNSSFSTTIMGFIPVSYSAGTQTTDAHSGSYAMQLQRQTISAMSQTFQVPGLCQLGEFNIDTIISMVMSQQYDLDLARMMGGGVPFTQIPINVKAWVKFIPDGNVTDTMLIAVYLTKHNELTGDQIVAQGLYYNNNAMNDYTEVTIPIEVLIDGETPENLNIIFSTAAGYNCGEAELFVDDISVETPSGIKEFNSFSFSVTPNPSSDVITVHTQEIGAFTVEMFDLSGRKVLQLEKLTENASIPVAHLSAGTYLLQVTQDNKVSYQKVVIE